MTRGRHCSWARFELRKGLLLRELAAGKLRQNVRVPLTVTNDGCYCCSHDENSYAIGVSLSGGDVPPAVFSAVAILQNGQVPKNGGREKTARNFPRSRGQMQEIFRVELDTLATAETRKIVPAGANSRTRARMRWNRARTHRHTCKVRAVGRRPSPKTAAPTRPKMRRLRRNGRFDRGGMPPSAETQTGRFQGRQNRTQPTLRGQVDIANGSTHMDR